MGKLYCLMGKSSSGKDTIYKCLLEDSELALNTVVPYTTRPMRAGETDGVEYHFCTDEECGALGDAGRIIELRTYNTVQGLWKYFTVDDGAVKKDGGNYLYITTLAAYEKLRDYYGKDFVRPIYIEVDDGVRLLRALEREMAQETPQYEEMCRRFLADAADFSEEKLSRDGIEDRFTNSILQETVRNIKGYIADGYQS
jgi:guanylate kinase